MGIHMLNEDISTQICIFIGSIYFTVKWYFNLSKVEIVKDKVGIFFIKNLSYVEK